MGFVCPDCGHTGYCESRTPPVSVSSPDLGNQRDDSRVHQLSLTVWFLGMYLLMQPWIGTRSGMPWQALVLELPIGTVVTVVLVIDDLRDRTFDRHKGRKTTGATLRTARQPRPASPCRESFRVVQWSRPTTCQLTSPK